MDLPKILNKILDLEFMPRIRYRRRRRFYPSFLFQV